jgi:microsomal dipeptidase-like Zn-dependent dipeptidase
VAAGRARSATPAEQSGRPAPLTSATPALARLYEATLDRVLHRVAVREPGAIRPEVLAFHRSTPVVDLLVGTALFHRDLLRSRAGGQVDLARLRQGGIDLVGLSIATRFPDLRGTLSAPHFRLLGLPVGKGELALVEALVGRIEGWAERSGGGLVLVRRPADLAVLGDGRVHAFLGVQGGHVLEGEPRNVERLTALGIRVFGIAHVMDNELVGSNTGRRGYGLTPFGREVIAELEGRGIIVDLAHVSSAGIRDALPLLTRPFLVSHTGLLALAGGRSRWRRYAPATRNVSSEDARLVAQAGGVIGLTLSTSLLGARTPAAFAQAVHRAAETVGLEHLAIGSDFDGGLETIVDAARLPALTQALLDSGFSREAAAAILGGNALRTLRATWS